MNIVQIGAHVGQDGKLELIQDNENKIKKCVLIEPLQSSLGKCIDFYKENLKKEVFDKITFLNQAVVPDESINTVDFFVPQNEHDSPNGLSYTAFCSTRKDHVEAHLRNSGEKIKKITVTASSLNAILRDHIGTGMTIDRLFVDAEGVDGEILLSLNLDLFDIPYICFEGLHLDGVMTGVHQKVQEKNSISNRLFYEKFMPNNYNLYTFFDTDERAFDYDNWAIKSDRQDLVHEVERLFFKKKNGQLQKFNW
mgnify:FL=1